MVETHEPGIDILIKVQFQQAGPCNASGLWKFHEDSFISTWRPRWWRPAAESEVELNKLGVSKVEVCGNQLTRALLSSNRQDGLISSAYDSAKQQHFPIRALCENDY